MAYTRAQRLANLAKARRARWPKHKDEDVASNGAPAPTETTSQSITSLTMETFVTEWRKIVRSDSVQRLDYFVTLRTWIDGMPKGTATTLSQTLGYHRGWVNQNLRPLRAFGEAVCRSLVARYGWAWADIALLSATSEEARAGLLKRALQGESRQVIVNGVYASFSGAKVGGVRARNKFMEAIDAASPSQVAKWLSDYLNSCSPARAGAIRRHLHLMFALSLPERPAPRPEA